MNWIEVEENVWVWEMDENKYRVVSESWSTADRMYLLKDKIIDISKLTKEEIKESTYFWYESFEKMKQIEIHWKPILAGTYLLYSEKEEGILSSKNKEAILLHLKNQYGFVTRFKNLQRTPLFKKLYQTYKNEISDKIFSEEHLEKEEMKEEVKKAFVSYLQWEMSDSCYRYDNFEAEELLLEHGYLEVYKEN